MKLWDAITCAVSGISLTAGIFCPYWSISIAYWLMAIGLFIMGITPSRRTNEK